LGQRWAWASRITFTTGLSAPTEHRPLLLVGVPKSVPFVPRFHSSLSAPRSRCAIHNFEKIAISLQSIKLLHPLAPDRVPLKRNSRTKEPLQIYVDSSAGCREEGVNK